MDNFIGMGHNPNPNVPDIPMGFGMELMQNPKAMENYGKLSDNEKTRLIKEIQTATTGDEAKLNIDQAIEILTKPAP